MKLWLTISILIMSGLARPAYGDLQVAVLETTALDALGNPELHLLLCGIPMPTTRLRVQSNREVHDIPWSWKNSTADLWLAIGKWQTLIVQLVYADNSRDTVKIRASEEDQSKNESPAKCGPGNVL